MNLNNEETAAANAAAEKILGDIICLAEGAIGACAGEDEAARTPLYAAALECIRDLVRRDWLDMGDFRLTRFHAGDTTTFVGADKAAGRLVEIRIHGDGLSNYLADFTENGIRIATMDFNHAGRNRCERMAVGVLHGLFGYRKHDKKH